MGNTGLYQRLIAEILLQRGHRLFSLSVRAQEKQAWNRQGVHLNSFSDSWRKGAWQTVQRSCGARSSTATGAGRDYFSIELEAVVADSFVVWGARSMLSNKFLVIGSTLLNWFASFKKVRTQRIKIKYKRFLNQWLTKTWQRKWLI